MTGFNLLTSSWLPVRRRSGPALIRPAELTAEIVSDPVISLDWPRADFRVAGLEFLIGLLATACPPVDEEAWPEWWHAPPSPEVLDAAFAPLVSFFNLDGGGPRFLQDLEELEANVLPIESLLIEVGGENALAHNAHLLAGSAKSAAFGRGTAAMALYTLQSWAPAGGRGNRVGLRGGGPMVTLVRPPEASLWHQIWANVPCGAPPGAEEWSRVFPWTVPTRTSADDQEVVPRDDAHPLQAYWSMSRRIRLLFTPAEGRRCALTGTADDILATGWVQRPYGPKYAHWGRLHVLTPYSQPKPGAEYLPQHPQPGGIGYRHWLGLVAGGEGREPAATVRNWRNGRSDECGVGPGAVVHLLAAGYDMDKMKPRAFDEAEMPLPGGATPAAREALDQLAQALVLAADAVASQLHRAVRSALFSSGATVKTDSGLLFASLRERLWEETEAPFFAALESASRRGPATGVEPERLAWLGRLAGIARTLFDEAAPMADENIAQAPRIARARRGLGQTLAGYGRDGIALFKIVGIAAPEQGKPAKGRKSARMAS